MWYNRRQEEILMGLVKTRRLAAMQKQQRAKAGMLLNGWALHLGLGSHVDFLVVGEIDV